MAVPEQEAELRALSALVRAEVAAFERSPWGFENRTDIVTLADGRRLVVQRITRRFYARRRLLLGEAVPPLLASAGVRAPRQLAADPDADPPYAVREFLPGTPANRLLDSPAGARDLARAMGALLPRIAGVQARGLPLPEGWADPQRLADESRGRLLRCRSLLSEPTHAQLAGTIAALPGLFAGRPPVFAHGDFCPVNALVLPAAGGQPPEVALVDFDEARLADPLFDAAWWGWVVRFHHPERWRAAWPALLAAAGIQEGAATRARVRALQLLRLLEALDEARAHLPQAAGSWAQRLEQTAGWEQP